MDKGIYTALSGGLAKSRELELVANNLANANTPGFKGDTGTFNEYLTELRRNDSVDSLQREISAETLQDGRPPGDKSFVELDGVYTSFSQGPLQRTGRSLDVALEGNGFFEVFTPQGIRYTRQGNFSVNNEGRLVTINGYPVLAGTRQEPRENRNVELSTAGRLLSNQKETEAPAEQQTLPPDRRFIDLGEGPVSITPDGGVYQNGQQVATLSVEAFHEPQLLEKVGNSYFRNTKVGNTRMGQGDTKIHQGFLEGSNINPVKEMTKLIEVTRAYESHMQAIKTYQDIDARSVNEIARNR